MICRYLICTYIFIFHWKGHKCCSRKSRRKRYRAKERLWGWHGDVSPHLRHLSYFNVIVMLRSHIDEPTRDRIFTHQCLKDVSIPYLFGKYGPVFVNVKSMRENVIYGILCYLCYRIAWRRRGWGLMVNEKRSCVSCSLSPASIRGALFSPRMHIWWSERRLKSFPPQGTCNSLFFSDVHRHLEIRPDNLFFLSYSVFM